MRSDLQPAWLRARFSRRPTGTLSFGILVWGLVWLAGCAGPAVCPTNQAASAPPGERAKGSPVKSAGTYDKNGRLIKKNAFHPSSRQVGN